MAHAPPTRAELDGGAPATITASGTVAHAPPTRTQTGRRRTSHRPDVRNRDPRTAPCTHRQGPACDTGRAWNDPATEGGVVEVGWVRSRPARGGGATAPPCAP
ncbi:hypothetical protein GCM10023340_29700 [Nocardioides marinquilinus]|uniref:Uncharacterized protein n=1 Tax=Nocardioides marinquilinus TaxID=1210400 RepID=A0ABP9PRW5_9ACTN